MTAHDEEFARLVARGRAEADFYAEWLSGTTGEALSPFAVSGLAHSFGTVMKRRDDAEPVAWQWSDFSGTWYTVDTARLPLAEQEELARAIAKDREGRVRPLFTHPSTGVEGGVKVKERDALIEAVADELVAHGEFSSIPGQNHANASKAAAAILPIILTAIEPVAASPGVPDGMARLQGSVPEGWKLVPVEPTEAMMNAAPASYSSSFMAIWPKICGDIYRALLAAAPASPEPSPSTEDVMGEAVVAGWNACRRSIYAVCEDITERQYDPASAVRGLPTLYQEGHAKGFHAGGHYAAKSIARGFNAMEALDDDNVTEALRALSSKQRSGE